MERRGPIAKRSAVAIVCMSLLVWLGHSAEASVEPRIIGGTSISITEAPWQVALIVSGPRGQSLCGGVIVSESMILTAAHCVDETTPAGVNIVVGSTQLSQPQVILGASNLWVYPGWTPRLFRGDIALVQTSAPISFGPTQQPISLPLDLNPVEWPIAGTPASVSGWGGLSSSGPSSDSLQRGNVQIETGPGVTRCGRYPFDIDAFAQMCAGLPAGGVDACQGDSGGGLVVAVGGRPTLAGLVSAGAQCGSPSFPGIYTRVLSYLPWIQEVFSSAGSPPSQPDGSPAAPTQPVPVIPPSPSPLPVDRVPSTPQDVVARARSGGAVGVSWTGGVAGNIPSAFQATATPGDHTCATLNQNCVLTGLQPGRNYVVTVVAINNFSVSPTSEPIQVTAVNKTGRVGTTISLAKQRKTVRVESSTKANCRIQALGIRLTKPGICRVRVGASLFVVEVRQG